MAEFRRIAKNGHSWQVVLPRAYLLELGIRPRDVVMIELVGGALVISRAVSARQLDLTKAKTAPPRGR